MKKGSGLNGTLDIDPLDVLLGAEDVAPVRLGEAVIEKLTQAILDGRLKPGDALPSEGRIAASFGVSKQVAREAIRELAAMGVVHIQQGKVTRIRDLDAEPLGRFFRFAVRGSATGINEAIELRRILEPPTTRLAAKARSEAELANLAAILARMEESLGDVPSWIEADLDFHEAIGTMSGNRLLKFQIRALRPIISEIMEIFNSRGNRGPAEWRETYERHVRIFNAIKAGNANAAFDAMSQHFEAADAAVKELFSGE
ncbi:MULTISPECIES: FadR/GntR family transcriptional regulator [unclassified Chelatococcus]|uniref:FadR/GntR family transcriptional regulator n=1 Tax=unclassified Chelatococcus TaxID=2638111 RepID=UPI001BCDD5D0|nr:MULTISPECIES: FadR/GntR family transcriptional regulator [unclassified Chelatococcus]MBS7738756.1 FadR family transcriptional regulator [Chelatococcus sp. HY11]MBX3543160.1 FadR family transcriptional regulator [Chelatococcus sp.]MCO5076714.1 FadR family transcriptional regulator [Chelatococcus sp.]